MTTPTPLGLRVHELVLLGAHADDLAIAAGGTLLTLAARGAVRVRALVLTGSGTARAAEEEAALAALLPGCDLDLTVLDLPDGLVPDHRAAVKAALHRLAAGPADLVLAPHPGDAHQDHRVLAELVPTEFRHQLTLTYEIPKWENDLLNPVLFVPLPEAVLRRKIAVLHEHYPSQSGRDWFDEETFAGLARLRGVQCRERFAEAFGLPRATLDLQVAR